MTFFIGFEGLGDTNSNDAFMFGLLVRERKIKASQYISFVAESPGKIRVAWRDFIGRLESFSSDIYLFHYGSYERQVLEGLGSRTDQARLSPRLFDLLPSVTHHASLPSRGFSLKVVAGELGFWWEDDDADGRYAGKWWDLWRRKRDSEAFNRLRQYNADDLRALALVREWFLEFPDCIPSKRRLKLLRTRATRIEIVERHRVLELCLG